MWSKNGTPVETSIVPLPSRLSEIETEDSFVLLSTLAVLIALLPYLLYWLP
jgi:hypothetical protein